MVAAEGINATTKKVEDISLAIKPKSITELRSFLGLVDYYGKFIPQLVFITQLLNARITIGNGLPSAKKLLQP